MVLCSMKLSAWLIAVALTACSSATPSTDTADDQDVDTKKRPVDEPSEDDDLATRATRQREQCSALADFIQGSENDEAIVNLNDSKKLHVLADKRASIATVGMELTITAEGLPQLHRRYVDLCNDIASSLRDAANNADAFEKKKAVERYRKLDEDVGALIKQINAFCAIPVTE
jgi:hypothetical protein